MYRKTLRISSLLLLAATVGPAPAEQAALTPEKLSEQAKLVVTGTVKAIHLTHSKDRFDYVLDIVVQTAEKGVAKRGAVVKARGYRRTVQIKGGNGHWVDFNKLIRGRPIRVFLTPADGGEFDILYPKAAKPPPNGYS